jgi:hypothetical protein
MKKIYKSVSITFYDNNLGYLFCEEFRYREDKILNHPIGGKTETFDPNLFSAGLREFIEEANLLENKIINKESLEKQDLVLKLYNLFIKNAKFYNVCVNKDKNYFHRYFIIDISNKKNNRVEEEIINLPVFFNGIYKTEINNIFWTNDIGNIDFINQSSWLLKRLIKKL